MLNFVYLRSSRLIFLHFWLDSCIVNKGEKFELELACCTNLEGFQVVLIYFWAQAVPQVASAWPVRGTGLTGVVPRCWAMLSTGLTGEADQSDWSELSCCSCSVHVVFCMHSSRGMWQPAQENTELSPKSNPLWSLSNSKVSSCR
jgi:hypothetical protein